MGEMKKFSEEMSESKSGDGVKVSGIGILVSQMDKLLKLVDKTNLNLYHVEKRLERIETQIMRLNH